LSFSRAIAYDFSENIGKLKSAKTIREIMGVEGDVAWEYRNEISKAIPEKLSISYSDWKKTGFSRVLFVT
jgi:CRISPR/Cas system-associated endonuclease Cas1